MLFARSRRPWLAALTVSVVSGTTFAQFHSPHDVPLEIAVGFAEWELLADAPAEIEALTPWVRPLRVQVARIDAAELATQLEAAPLEFSVEADEPLVIALPTPDGGFERFALIESPVMAPELAAQFPEIRTYAGYGLDDPYAQLRMDTTPAGVHAQVLTPGYRWYIDPYSQGDDTIYSVYYARDLAPRDALNCELFVADEYEAPPIPPIEQLNSGGELRTYRTAVAATGEYTQFHGGTVSAGLAAIVTAINRVTGVYERDVAARLQLVANNNLLVYTNPNTDPYSNFSGGTMLGQNQSNIDSVIGNANYDIGHVFSTGGGGVAYLGVVCDTGWKARGVTGQPSPIGDPFTIDYVAHEVGHQFGANHSFNGTGGSCSGGNRNGSTAYEPGSGSTIMAYAGICGSDNLQNNSHAYFHGISYTEMRALMLSRTCHAASATGNTPPVVDAGPNYTIPRNTPFRLTASASDANGDAMTYNWEQFSIGPAQSLAAADNGTSPLFRSWNSQTTPTRYFPRLSNLLAGTTPTGEKLPSVNRTATFRCTVRDNRTGGGGVAFDTMQITVNASVGPFTVTGPTTGSLHSGTLPVTWNVAGTQVISPNVDILLSTDAGASFPHVLISGTPNDGSETVPLPQVTTSQARIMVVASQSVFLNVNPGLFSIEPAATPCPGDIDGNGSVDLNDLLAVLASFGVNDGGDTNGDGETDLEDLLTVLSTFGPC